jgi:hypothetical protein
MGIDAPILIGNSRTRCDQAPELGPVEHRAVLRQRRPIRSLIALPTRPHQVAAAVAGARRMPDENPVRPKPMPHRAVRRRSSRAWLEAADRGLTVIGGHGGPASTHSDVSVIGQRYHGCKIKQFTVKRLSGSLGNILSTLPIQRVGQRSRDAERANDRREGGRTHVLHGIGGCGST